MPRHTEKKNSLKTRDDLKTARMIITKKSSQINEAIDKALASDAERKRKSKKSD